ncbi:MAG: methionyl-tRNA formyltransferase [Sandaracinus sp.]
MIQPIKPRAMFFGTPEIAATCLDAVASLCDVVRVVAQPDRPSGRGNEVRPPAVKVRALELGIPVEQPTKIKPPEVAAAWRALEVDVAVVVAYGRILPKAVLEAPRRGCVNVHASLLPRWRGAAPIQWSVVSGDAETGVCLMEMDEGLDTGPVISTMRTPIGENETSGELFSRLGPMGAELLRRDLLRWLGGELVAHAQQGEASYARMLEKSDAVLDFSQPAKAVHDRARGLHPWPGAETRIAAQRAKIHVTRVLEASGRHGRVGELVRVSERGLEVACGEGLLGIVEAQLDGKKRVPAGQLANGLRLSPGASLG